MGDSKNKIFKRGDCMEETSGKAASLREKMLIVAE